MSLAKVSGDDFSRAFLNQVELGRSQPSTRVLRVIAGPARDRGRLPAGRSPARRRAGAGARERPRAPGAGDARRALLALRPAVDSTEWPLGSDARLCQAEALQALGREAEANEILARERELISAHRDRHRLQRLRSVERGKRFTFGPDPVKTHLRLADQAQRGANSHDALEHYRAARVLLETR